MSQRYPSDVLAPGWRQAGRVRSTPVAAEIGLVVEDVASGFCGAVVRVEAGLLTLEDRHGQRRGFRLGPGFLIDGRPVELTAPTRQARSVRHTASGSLVADPAPAKVAQPSRIWVEGIHDAELVEKVWGDDLRYLGVVVEPLGGIDQLAERVAAFAPTASRRLGILVDHLIEATKETHIVTGVRQGPYSRDVLITGHRYIDIWQAVRPAALGLAAWPTVPRGQDFKRGTCAQLGWPYDSEADLGRAWQRILSRVTSWRDLDRPFVTEVERLIDFVQPDDLA
jgi:hypothetical protein